MCEPKCPAEAIFPDTRPGLESWLELNAKYAALWPNITVKREAPVDAGAFDGVTDNCIRCKYMDCVEVCPVDCFYEGDNMLVIHPDECIDCGVCEPECPVDAIKPDTEAGAEKWLKLNADYAKIWPNITIRRDPPADSKEWEGKPDKLKYFSPNPGKGD